MYETFFGLTRRPFSTTPEPDYFVPTPMMTRALQELTTAVRAGHAIAILTGAAGTGKTLLCRKLAADLSATNTCVLLANANFGGRRELLQALLYELGHPYRAMDEQELRLELTGAVRSAFREGRPVVVIVDEAHLLSEPLLEEIRTVTNLSEDGRSLVQVVFSGQFPLEEKLAEASLQALNQRVHCQVTLEHLTRQESAAYIDHSFRAAGAVTQEILTQEAAELIGHVSDGVPRCLSLLCDHSLLLASLAGRRPVDADIVRDAFHDLKQLPLHWNDPPVTAMAETDGSRNPPIEPSTSQDRTGRTSAGGTSESRPAGFETGGTAASVPPESGHAGDVTDRADSTPPHDDRGSMDVIEVGAAESTGDNTGRNGFGVPAFDRGESGFRDSAPDSVEVGRPAPERSRSHDGDPLAADVFQSGSFEDGGNAPSFAADGFVEEVVVDRYAMIDAGLGAPEQQNAPPRGTDEEKDSFAPPAPAGQAEGLSDESRTEVRQPAGETETGAGPGRDEFLDEPAQLVDAPFVQREPPFAEPDNPADGDEAAEILPRQPRPDLLIDEMKARLDEALAPTVDETASGEAEDRETPLQTMPHASSEEPADEDVEERIGTAVVDACYDVRQAFQQDGHEPEDSVPAEEPDAQEDLFFFTPQTETPPAEPGTDRHETVFEGPFDTVEPEEDEYARFDPSNDLRFTEEGSRAFPEMLSQTGGEQGRRNYSDLFSRLRNRPGG